MPKRFTLAEAEKLIGEVEPLLRSAVSLKTEYDSAEREMNGFSQHIMLAGGVVVDRAAAVKVRNRRESAATRLRSTIEEVQALGCVVKDLDIGLVDFPTLFRGREVYLCWKLGEPRIAFWHGTDEGFRGRKPIDDDFRAHHSGDAAQ